MHCLSLQTTLPPPLEEVSPDLTALSPDQTLSSSDQTASSPDQTASSPDQTASSHDQTASSHDQMASSPNQTISSSDQIASSPDQTASSHDQTASSHDLSPDQIITAEEDLPLIKPKDPTAAAVADQLGDGSGGLFSSHLNPPATAAVGRKIFIELVEEDEDSTSWATIVSSSKLPSVSQDEQQLIVEDLQDHSTEHDQHELVATAAVPWFEEAGRVPDGILHEYDTHQQLSATGEGDQVWTMALKAGSTLEEDKVELDDITKRKLKERVDSTSLCF